jgi:RNA polymerase sigma-70 factor (ECF subfamily)
MVIERSRVGELNQRWVEQWRSGYRREDCVRKIFVANRPRVMAFFARRGLPAEESRDLCQETFLRAFRRLESFRGDTAFEHWLLHIAANLWCNAQRHRAALKRKAQEVSLEDLDETAPQWAALAEGGGPSPLDQLVVGEQSRQLRAAVGKLPAQMQRCVHLRIIEELKYREIATRLRISIDTVKALLFQAHRRLQIELMPPASPLGGKICKLSA